MSLSGMGMIIVFASASHDDVIPQTVLTMEGFWRLLFRLGGSFPGLSAACGPLPNRVHYIQFAHLSLQNASETGGHEHKYCKNQ